MYTEEAKKKWCPMVRLIAVTDKNEVINSTSYNKAMQVKEERIITPAGSTCIASDCMMWRWEYERVVSMPKRTTSGYCGLAGRIL